MENRVPLPVSNEKSSPRPTATSEIDQKTAKALRLSCTHHYQFHFVLGLENTLSLCRLAKSWTGDEILRNEQRKQIRGNRSARTMPECVGGHPREGSWWRRQQVARGSRGFGGRGGGRIKSGGTLATRLYSDVKLLANLVGVLGILVSLLPAG